MPSRKKKFIDKKHAVTFSVVHRSQKDPKTADEEAPQHVLLSSHREEQLKFGIEFEDDYDYLQHLKDVKELCEDDAETFRIGRPSSETILLPHIIKPRLQLPSVVFASNVETTVGMLNKNVPLKGPQPDMDPDILAALDGEMMSDEELEDNFFSFANAENIEEKGDNDSDDENSSTCAMSDDDDDDDDEGGDGNDNKSRFTGCSMTSSVIRRNDNLKLVDAKFEKFYEKFKNDEDDDDDDIADDETDEENDKVLQQLINQYQKKEEDKALAMIEFVENTKNLNMHQTTETSLASSDSESSHEEMEKIEIQVPDHNWDCESILSTYSTTKNQPQTVYLPSKKPIKTTSRLQIPVEVSLSNKPAPQTEENDVLDEKMDLPIIRNKNETKEERSLRKKMIKEYRKERRQQKSQTKEFFKEEISKMKKQLIVNKENCIGAVHLQ